MESDSCQYGLWVTSRLLHSTRHGAALSGVQKLQATRIRPVGLLRAHFVQATIAASLFLAQLQVLVITLKGLSGFGERYLKDQLFSHVPGYSCFLHLQPDFMSLPIRILTGCNME